MKTMKSKLCDLQNEINEYLNLISTLVTLKDDNDNTNSNMFDKAIEQKEKELIEHLQKNLKTWR